MARSPAMLIRPSSPVARGLAVASGLLLAIPLAFTGACGGSVDAVGGASTTSSAGGTSQGGAGTAGAKTGGTGNEGGGITSSSSSSGTTSSSSSSSSSSGMTSSSSSSSSSGTMPNCPTMEPQDGDQCMGQGTQCAYGANQCTCFQQSWHCNTCPTSAPTDGATCNIQGTCAYGATQCNCQQGNWQCATCPATTPQDNTMCEQQGLHCTYADATCNCGGPGPGGASWHCQAACPTSAPQPGDACNTGPMQQCSYGNTTCVCLQGQFFCN